MQVQSLLQSNQKFKFQSSAFLLTLQTYSEQQAWRLPKPGQKILLMQEK